MVGWSGDNRRGFTQSQRAAILRRDRVCQICGLAPATIADHIQPVAEGGPDNLSNGQGVCSQCHDVKTKAEQARGRARHRGARPPDAHPGYVHPS